MYIDMAFLKRYYPQSSLTCLACVCVASLTLSACSSNSNGGSNGDSNGSSDDGSGTSGGVANDPDEPVFDVSRFDDTSAVIDNPLFPLSPGATAVLSGQDDEGAMIKEVNTVSHETRDVAGIASAIVVDREFENGEMVEETFDWYAQDIEGNVWYMGEASAEFEDGELESTDGSWEAGVDVDGTGEIGRAGILMKANPVVGDTYQHEIYPGVAEDEAEIVALDAPVMLADGSTYSTLQVRERDPLDASGMEEFKYYASDIGLVVEEKADGSERLELTERRDQTTPVIQASNFSNSTNINNPLHPLEPGASWTYEAETEDGTEEILVEVLDETRIVMGIVSRVVRDRVFLDELLIEDTHDWFAQDDDGTVWYMGEEVVNYEHDDDGNVISTDNEGAWEAGVDGAQPGIQMLATPRVGDSYRQEYRRGEAEDIAAVAALNVSVVLDDGGTYITLQTREWNPLETDSGDEFKYYAPGVGLVREEDEEGEESADLIMLVQP